MKGQPSTHETVKVLLSCLTYDYQTEAYLIVGRKIKIEAMPKSKERTHLKRLMKADEYYYFRNLAFKAKVMADIGVVEDALIYTFTEEQLAQLADIWNAFPFDFDESRLRPKQGL